MCEICEKNISQEKFEKLRNYLFKMKEFIYKIIAINEIILGKGLLASIKEQLCLTKGHLVKQEERLEIK